MSVPNTPRAAPVYTPVPPAAFGRTDFFAAQRANRRATWQLIILLVLLGAVLGYALGWAVETIEHEQMYQGGVAAMRLQSAYGFYTGGVLAGIGVLAALVTFLWGDRIIARMGEARAVGPDEEPLLHNVVEEMALASGLPKPTVMIVESAALNAFATGQGARRGAIAVTRGLLVSLPRDELQGVVAHEMAHIGNGDSRYMAAVAIMVGLIVLVGDAAWRSVRHIPRMASSRDRKGGGVAVMLIALVVVLAVAALMPVAAMLVRFAVSRQREFLADATAIQFTRNPEGLIAALERISGDKTGFPEASRSLQHMYISNPFGWLSYAEDWDSDLFSTHPTAEQRTSRLRNLGGL